MQELLNAVKMVEALVKAHNESSNVVKSVSVFPWATIVELSKEQALLDTKWMQEVGATMCQLEINGITVQVEPKG